MNDSAHVPSHRQRAWEERQRRAAQRSPRIRVDGCEIVRLPSGDRYEAMIRGWNLRGVISPPAITVGGVPLQDVRFEDRGRTVRGTLAAEPESEIVVVDYGFARAEAAGVRRAD